MFVITEENKGAKNLVKFSDGAVKSKTIKPQDDCSFTNFYVMPDIEDVKTIEDSGEVKVVIVTFADGSYEKSVLSDEDTYSLEQGISICITKKLLSDKTAGSGSAVYNKIMNHAKKVMRNNREREAAEIDRQEKAKAKFEKIVKKKAANKEKREKKMRDRMVAIQAEAYLQAMMKYEDIKEMAK